MASDVADLENPESGPPEDLGPFEPPKDFDHGDGFDGEPPRPIPAFARRSRYVRARQMAVWSCLTVAAACWLSAPLPFIQTLSFYLLPLGYLSWCGAGLAILAGIFWLRNTFTAGHLDYFRRGEPLVGRIQSVNVNAEGTAEAPMGRFMAVVEYRRPETQEVENRIVAAEDQFSLAKLPKYAPGVEPGEYATLVAFPDRFDQSLKLYGWLGIDPDVDFITKNGKPLKSMTPLGVLGLVVLFTALAWLLLGFIYVLGRYEPLEFDGQIFAVSVAICSILPVILFQWNIDRSGTAMVVLMRRVWLFFLGTVAGAFLGFLGMTFINGVFDRSTATYEPIRIVETWNTTWNFILRNYELEYEPWPNGKTDKQMVSVEAIFQFNVGDLGFREVGEGALGMRWIRSFQPIYWLDVDSLPEEDRDRTGAITFQLPEEDPRTIVPRFVKSDSLQPIPEILLAESVQREIAYLQQEAGAKMLPSE